MLRFFEFVKNVFVVQCQESIQGRRYGAKVWNDENGQLHRTTGPAYDDDSLTEWRIHGVLHREGGPAKIVKQTGTKYYYRHGFLHRHDGPAVIHANGKEEYFVEGFAQERPITLKTTSFGQQEWRDNDGKLHCNGSPALITQEGTKCWCRDGGSHRGDGPAMEWANGDRFWYRNNKLHREDGPAIEKANGYKEYYHDGTQITHKEFLFRIGKDPFHWTENQKPANLPEVDLKDPDPADIAAVKHGNAMSACSDAMNRELDAEVWRQIMESTAKTGL
jgi:hypothetical protein